MTQEEVSEKPVALHVENVGGIDESSVEFDRGVTVLPGRNATNRTSFMQAIMAVTGSDNVTLKADADEGCIELEIGGETYSRTLSRRDGHVILNGEPYLEDSTLADLFAFLLEMNECRQAVARGDDLHEVIMRPIDTSEIDREIRELENEGDEIDSKLSDLDTMKGRLPDLEREKQQLQEDLADKKSQLTDKEEELARLDKSIEESREENEALDSKMSELQSTRTDLERVRREIESEQESIDALQDELQEQRATFDDVSFVSADRIGSVEKKTQRLRGQVDAIDQTINEFQSIIQFNEEFLGDGQPEIASELRSDSEPSDDAVTDRLLDEGDIVTCWTCGTDVATEQIETNLDSLRDLRQEKMESRQSLEEDIREREGEKRELEERQQRYEDLQRTIDRTESEVESRKETLETLRTRQAELEAEVSQLEADVEELQQADQSEVLEVQEAVNRLEFERDDLQSDLESIEDEITSIERQLDERADLEGRRTEIQQELENLRTRVEQLQEQAIESFNDHMDAVLDLLDYDNLERIWIERTTERVRDGRRKVEQERFDLHVVRSTDSGTVYEDTVGHLSESEREVTGLVFALAGYLVHDVYETVPFMLIDSIEAIDSERIARLVDYLEGYSDYLVVALLEEDAAALDDSYSRITPV